jgi:hypothetical protein
MLDLGFTGGRYLYNRGHWSSRQRERRTRVEGGDCEAPLQQGGCQLGPGPGRQIHHPGYAVRLEIPSGGLSDRVRVHCLKRSIFPVQERYVFQGFGRGKGSSLALHGLESPGPARLQEAAGATKLFDIRPQ